MRDVRRMLLEEAADRDRPFLLAARVPASVEGCRIDGLDIGTWAAQELVDILIIGTRTINVDLASFRKTVGDSPVKLIPSFDFYHGADGYHNDQSLELLRGIFGNYLHQEADGVGIFNIPAGAAEHARKFGIKQHLEFDPAILNTIGSLSTIVGKPRCYVIDRRGGYAHFEGYGSSNLDAPLPVTLRYDGTPSTLKLPVWEIVSKDVIAKLRLVLFEHVGTDEISVKLNDVLLSIDTVDSRWKDPRIFSPDPQPETVTPYALNRNLAEQKLTRIEFLVPVESIQSGENTLVIAVKRKGPFHASHPVKVEKVELHLIGS
jgi:hypothetical protein